MLSCSCPALWSTVDIMRRNRGKRLVCDAAGTPHCPVISIICQSIYFLFSLYSATQPVSVRLIVLYPAAGNPIIPPDRGQSAPVTNIVPAPAVASQYGTSNSPSRFRLSGSPPCPLHGHSICVLPGMATTIPTLTATPVTVPPSAARIHACSTTSTYRHARKPSSTSRILLASPRSTPLREMPEIRRRRKSL